MTLKRQLEQDIEEMQLKMSKLAIEIDQFNFEYEELFSGLELTPEQLTEHMTNPENFSAEEWEEIQQEKKKLDEKLMLDLSHIPDLKKTKQTSKDLSLIQSHWIFVR
jgi:hypothetical protein